MATAAVSRPSVAIDSCYALADMRDAFLASLDADDGVRTIMIARHLVRCGNPLPNATCAALGIANGSSYGAGALAVLGRADAMHGGSPQE
jgi:hypothetical protein